MPSNAVLLTVNGKKIDYLINTTAGSGGIIANDCILPYQDTTSIFIVPMTGYRIKDVVVDGKSVGAVSTYDFKNVAANHTVIATFIK